MDTPTPDYPISEEPFDLVIRLQQFAADQPLDGAMVRAQALVKDVLLSRLRVDAQIDAQENVRAQGSDDLGKVLAASRALQIAFEGFRDASAAGHTSVSMVLGITPVIDPDISSISPPTQVGDFVTSAKPSQVLITPSFYNRVPQFHSVCRLLPVAGGVYEFLWTNEQKLHEMQAEAARMPAHVPVQVPVHVQEPRQIAETTDRVLDQPDRAIAEPPVKAPAWDDSGLATEPELPARVSGDWLKGWSGRRISALSAGVVLVMLFAWLLHVFLGKPAPKTTSAPQPAETTTVTPPVRTPTAPPPPAKVKVAANSGVTPPQSGAQSGQSGAQSGAQPGVSTKPVRKASHTCSIDGPIPAFLKRAEADSNNGKYESAIRRFSEILECEPGNREAALELQKAKDSQKYAP